VLGTVDGRVKAIAPTGKGEVYGLGTDGKLWHGTHDEGHNLVADDVREITPTGNGEMYVRRNDSQMGEE
jgi:hypothetical protein